MPAYLNGNAFQISALPSAQSSSEVEVPPLFLLVETYDTLARQQKQQLESIGVSLESYAGDNVWVCRSERETSTVLAQETFVKDVRPIPPPLKIQPSLQDRRPEETSQTQRTVDIVLHVSAERRLEELSKAVSGMTGLPEEDMSFRRDNTILRVKVAQEKLPQIASLSDVASVEEVHDLGLHNNVARCILRTDDFANATSYRGANQIITVADTGFDTGDKDKPHPAFSGRVIELTPVGRLKDTDDTHGHGTHVCGSVVGNGTSDTMGGSIMGTAPEALLVVQALAGPDGQLFGKSKKTLVDLLTDAHDNHNSHIHTNSWGPDWTKSVGQIPYNNASADLDEFVWKHPDMVVLFSAGNDGEEKTNLGHIGAQAAAKNCITVGSCDNRRKSANKKIEIFKEQGMIEGNPDNVSVFSSRGPTAEHRIKPDIVAPGGIILSTASRHAEFPSKYGKSTDPLWRFSSGTSMSTPLVAGCIAAIRQALVEKAAIASPSASLLKALLINGAVDLGKPAREQGFGRVDLSNSIFIAGETKSKGFLEGTIMDEDGKDKVAFPSLMIKDLGKENSSTTSLKVTLVYMDMPNPVLQNNINLSVQAVNDQGYNKTSPDPDSNEANDGINNVKQVTMLDVPKNCEIKITVALHGVLLCREMFFSIAWSVN